MRTTTSIDGTRRLLCATGQTRGDRCFWCETHREPIAHESSEGKVRRLRRERGITSAKPNGNRRPRAIDRRPLVKI